LISSSDYIFIESYAPELFQDMLTQEKREGIWQQYYKNQPKMQRLHRMKIIDWLYEVLLKYDITDRSLMFQTVELMD
jgi:hypothetical protein